jgi:hypothetical protein
MLCGVVKGRPRFSPAGPLRFWAEACYEGGMALDRIYLTTAFADDAPGIVAIISRGQPQFGDDEVTVLDVERFLTEAEAESWFHRMMDERPWEQRQ